MFKGVTIRADGVQEGISISTMTSVMKTMPKKTPMSALDNLIFVDFPAAVSYKTFPSKEWSIPKVFDCEKIFQKTKCIVLAIGDVAEVTLIDGRDLYLVHDFRHNVKIEKTRPAAPEKPWLSHPEGQVQHDAERWLALGEVGISSSTLCKITTGLGSIQQDEFCHPLDAADFRRCVKFLRDVPGARPELHKVAKLSPEWAVLVEHWDELEEALKNDLLDKVSGRTCYTRMKELFQSVNPTGARRSTTVSL